MEAFFLSFIPIFVAIDPFGILPFYIGMTQKVAGKARKKLATQAAFTALITSLTFALAGNYVFSFLGITAADFRIAGGLLLVIISIQELFGHTVRKTDGQTSLQFIGYVPIGIPIIAGPALVTTLLILIEYQPLSLIIMALLANLLLTFILLYYSDAIVKKIGEVPSKVFAKVVAIFLSAIGIMMIRKGIEHFFN